MTDTRFEPCITLKTPTAAILETLGCISKPGTKKTLDHKVLFWMEPMPLCVVLMWNLLYFSFIENSKLVFSFMGLFNNPYRMLIVFYARVINLLEFQVAKTEPCKILV